MSTRRPIINVALGLLLFLPALSWAGWLRCPYKEAVDETARPYRYVALADLVPQFEPLRAAKDTQSWPVQQEFEVQGTTKTSPNDAILFLDFGPLPAPLQTLITTTVGLGGGGCTTLTDPQKSGALIPARAPKLVNGTITYDADDTSRKVIDESRIVQEKVAPGSGTKGGALPTQDLLWRYAQRIFGLLSPRLAFAQQAFPLYGILDNFTYSDGNLSTVSSKWAIGPLAGTDLLVTSNKIIRSATTSDAYYKAVRFAFARGGELYVTIQTAAGSATMRQYFCQTVDTSCATLSGYQIKYLDVTGTTNDTFTVYRTDAGVDTQLSTVLTLEWATGDVLGVRNNDGVMNVYQNGSSVMSRTDTTYRGFGVYGLFSATSNSQVLDDFGGGSSPGGRRAIFYH